MNMKQCTKCKKSYPPTNEFFHKKKNSKDGLEYQCKSCRREKTLSNYYSNKKDWNETTKRNKKKQRERINEYKKSCKCSKCSEDRFWLLDFHHLDSSEKDFQISQGERYGWKKIKQEIDKCIVLCSNCHRDFHYWEKETNTNIKQYLQEHNG